MERVRLGNAYKAETRLPFGRKTTFFTLKYTVNGREKTFVKLHFPRKEAVPLEHIEPARCEVRFAGGDAGIFTEKFENDCAPSVFVPFPMNAENLLRVEGKIGNLSENEAVVTVSLVDRKGGEYPMGYDMAEQGAESEISVYCTDMAVNRLNNAEDTVWWHHRAENEARAAAFDFKRVTGLKIGVLNDRKMLDDNVERRLTEFTLFIRNLSITKKK